MKPFALPKQFQSLSDDQLTELHAWLDDPALTYKIIRAKLFELHGIKISDATLTRYNERRELADRVVNHEDSAKNIRTFLAIQNAQPIPYEEAGLALIPQRAFELACASKINASTLAALQRVFHYKTALAHTERRLAQNDQRITQADRRILQHDKRNEIAEATLQLKRDESARRAAQSSPSPLQGERAGVRGDSNQPQSDHLGPFASDLEGIRERARKHFGITPEESARRAALRKAWTARENSNSGDETHAAAEPVFVRENPSPEGTLDNSPDASAPGNLATFSSVPKGRLNSTDFQPAPNESNQ